EAAAPDGEYEHAVLAAQVAAFEPFDEHGFPALIVGSRRQLRDVVGWRIGFEVGELAKVVDRMPAVTGAAANAQKKQASASFANPGQRHGHELNRRDVQLVDDRFRLSEKTI